MGYERKRKKESRDKHKKSEMSQKLRGIKAKLYHKKRYQEKAAMKKTIKMHEEKDGKQKRKEKAGKWQVPIPKVKAMTEDEMFMVLRTGKRKQKAWKRVIDKATFVGDNFVRKNPKYERYIRPSALRYK